MFCVALTWLPGRRASAQIRFDPVSEDVVHQRLNLYKGNDASRSAVLHQLFIDAGCTQDHLVEQNFAASRQPNLICDLPGTTDQVIVVGAHFDHVDAGQGIVDNWSGASLLPSLLQGLRSLPRKHTYRFIGFTGEEKGLIGSGFYVRHLAPEEIAKIEGMLNLDTLGLGPAEVWASQSDPVLLNLLARVADATKLPVTAMNVDGFGESDEESFIARKVCTLTIHSVTPQTAHILHRPEDNAGAIHFADYYKTYQLLLAYLAALDTVEIAPHTCNTKPVGR